MSDETWFAEPVTGHRSWRLNPKSMTLEAAYGSWTTGLLEARCHKYNHEAPHWPEPVPDMGSSRYLPHAWEYKDELQCMCGINAYKLHMPLDQWRMTTDEDDEPSLDLQVVGIVDLGGIVHEYEHGYRGQYGRIMEAVVVSHVPYGSRFLGYLSDKYEAPFRVMSWSEYTKEWEATHGRDWETEEEDQDAEAGAEEEDDAYSIALTGSGLTVSGNSISGYLYTKPTATAKQVTNALGQIRWQPALSDGQRLWKFLSLPPKWRKDDMVLDDDKPILYRSERRALRHAKKMLKDDWRAS